MIRGVTTLRLHRPQSPTKLLAPKLHLLIPVLVFLIVNIPPWFGFSYLYVIFRWATLQNSLTLGGSEVLPVTYTSALATFLIATFLFKEETKLPFLDSVIQAAGLAFAATALFEITYQLIGYYFYPSTINGAIWLPNYVLNLSWFFLAVTSLQYWRLSNIFKLTASALVLSWGIWIAVGFPQLFENNAGLAFEANSITKILSFALMLSLVDFRNHSISSRESGTIPTPHDSESR